jgi:ATP-dependent Clp endopeptidase proteolytic subunit ClpP
MPKAKIYIYDTIGEGALTAKDFQLALDEAEKQGTTEFEVHINSYGGSVFDGIAIYNLLKSKNVITYVDGIAASIASVIAMAGKEVFMYKSTMLMIHNVWMLAAGDNNEMQKNADQLKQINESIIKIYMQKTGLSKSEITDMMDADTFLTDKEALKKGFVDGIVDPAVMDKGYVGLFVNLINDDEVKNKIKGKEMNKALLIFLGLPENATEQQINDKLAELRKQFNLKDDATITDIITASQAASALNLPESKNFVPRKEFDDLKLSLQHKENDDLVNGAIADGKILPADKEVWLNNAKVDYAGTKAKLDAKEKNSALPGKIKVNEEPEKVKSQKDIKDAAIAEIKSKMGK